MRENLHNIPVGEVIQWPGSVRTSARAGAERRRAHQMHGTGFHAISHDSSAVQVVVEEWPADSAYPSGHYCHTIGKIGDLATETEVLLLEYDVNTAPFSADVHACVPPLPWAVGPADHAAGYREDLRGTVVCSVDPPGCKDIDDALHARALPNGNIEVRPRGTVQNIVSQCLVVCCFVCACYPSPSMEAADTTAYVPYLLD